MDKNNRTTRTEFPLVLIKAQVYMDQCFAPGIHDVNRDNKRL